MIQCFALNRRLGSLKICWYNWFPNSKKVANSARFALDEICKLKAVLDKKWTGTSLSPAFSSSVKSAEKSSSLPESTLLWLSWNTIGLLKAILASLHRPFCSAFPLQTFCLSYVYPSVIHFFTKQLSQSKFIWQKLDIVLSNTSWKFHAKISSRSKFIDDSCFLSFQKKSPIVARSNWGLCSRKIVKIF